MLDSGRRRPAPVRTTAVDQGDAGEVLDDEAHDDYAGATRGLRDTLAEAESFGEPRRAKVREEIDFLGAELGPGLGLGGRAPSRGSAAERARSASGRR